MAPVAMDDGISDSELRALGESTVGAWRARGHVVTAGRASLVDACGVSEQPADVKAALASLDVGEKSFVDMAFADAAHAYGAGASGLMSQLDHLDQQELTYLYKARVMQGVALLEAGEQDAAIEAFITLLTLRLQYQPDPASMPPPARELFEVARARVRQRGLAFLDVATTPAGVQVWVNGHFAGRTPVTLSDMPLGKHRLKLVAPCREPILETVEVTANGASRALSLPPSEVEASLSRVAGGIARGLSADTLAADLRVIGRTAGVDQLILTAVAAPAAGRRVVSTVRWSGSPKAGAVWLVAQSEVQQAAGELVEALSLPTWPPVQLPAGSPALDTDFARSLLGIGPTWGRSEIQQEEEGGNKWWIWTTVAVVAVAGGVVTGLLLRDGSEGPMGPRQAGFTVEY